MKTEVQPQQEVYRITDDPLTACEIADKALAFICESIKTHQDDYTKEDLVEVLDQLITFAAIGVGNDYNDREIGTKFFEDVLNNSKLTYAVCIAHDLVEFNEADYKIKCKK